jgi:hypothetical protein
MEISSFLIIILLMNNECDSKTARKLHNSTSFNRIKCFDGNKTAENCYACYFAKITSKIFQSGFLDRTKLNFLF